MKNKENGEEGLNMNSTAQEYGYLDLTKLRTRVTKTISTQESLQDITPINWSEDVLSGKKMIQILKLKDNK